MTAPSAPELHVTPPMTLAWVARRSPWLLPVVAAAFVLLAALVRLDLVPWDQAIHDWVVDQRSPWRDRVSRRVSWFGSTPVVLSVSALGALAAWRRCPRLAIAIVVLALARPFSEFLLKELVGRDRPDGDRLVRGRGPSFPSGHPYATAASWGVLPLVCALYVRRRAVWWATAIAAWTLVVLVAASRVWLGVHWATDAVAGVLLAVLGVRAAEWFLGRVVGWPACDVGPCDPGAARVSPRRT